MKKVVITQSNYIPWKGYFDSIALADEFILLDEVQYTKRDWRNRNTIKTPQGLLWLSIPVQVKGKFNQSIRETMIAEPGWRMQHWKSIKMNYSSAPYFKKYAESFEELYLKGDESHLSEINLSFIKKICQILQIQTTIRFSEEFQATSGKTDRLLDICLKTNATDYYSGPAAKAYIEEDKFKDAGVKLHFLEYENYPIYPQLHGEFVHTVSVLDLIFNTGPQARSFMKH